MFPRFGVEKHCIYPSNDVLDLALILQQGYALWSLSRGPFAVKKIRNMLRKFLCKAIWRCTPHIIMAKGVCLIH